MWTSVQPSVHCPPVCCPSHFPFVRSRDVISVLSGEISMKLGTNIHHVGGLDIVEKVLKVRVQRSKSFQSLSANCDIIIHIYTH